MRPVAFSTARNVHVSERSLPPTTVDITGPLKVVLPPGVSAVPAPNQRPPVESPNFVVGIPIRVSISTYRFDNGVIFFQL